MLLPELVAAFALGFAAGLSVQAIAHRPRKANTAPTEKRPTMLSAFAYFKFRLLEVLRRRKPALYLFLICVTIACVILFPPTGLGDQASGAFQAESMETPEAHDPTILNHGAEPGRRMLPVGWPASQADPTPSPTPFPIPDTALIWNRAGSGAYLQEAPEGGILALLANGSEVRLLNERRTYGNMPWMKIYYPGGEGWVLAHSLFRVSALPPAFVTGRAWVNLRDRPQGRILRAAPPGTPVLEVLGSEQAGGQAWAKVRLMDGTVGWLVGARLSSEATSSD